MLRRLAAQTWQQASTQVGNWRAKSLSGRLRCSKMRFASALGDDRASVTQAS
jgi:hypothetical protein